MRNTTVAILIVMLLQLASCALLDIDNNAPLLSSEDIDSIRTEAQALRDMGRKHREKAELSEALNVQTKALELSLMLHDTLLIVQDYNQLGTTFRRLGRIENAMNNHYMALNYAEAYHEDSSFSALKNIVVSCNGIGNVHLSMGNSAMAEPYFRRSLVGEIKLNSLLGMAINYANIGSIYMDRNELDSAMWYFEQSMAKNQELNSAVGKSLCYVYFGMVYEKKDSIVKAETAYRKAVEIIEGDEDRYHAAEALYALAQNLYKQKRLAEAETYSEQVMEIAEAVHSFESLHDAYALRAQIAEAKGDVAGALENYKMSTAWGDSIVNPEKDNALHQICIDYEINASKNQVEQLQKAYDNIAQMHKVVTTIEFVLLLILAVVMGLILYASRSRKEKLTALNKLDSMRTTFFRNLTHEFRTPLTVIMGLADQMKTEEFAVEQRNHLLNSISQQGRTLLNLVNELLGISKMMSGNEKCEWRHGNIVAFLRVTMSGYADFARMRNIELHIDVADDQIIMDFVPDYYQKIINNLLGNSFKHTPSGGSITLKLETRSNHLMLDIIDTGDGITVEDLPHIFELFYQGRDAKNQGSAGIGLPYVQQMVRQMGGIIDAENNLPHGTTMHITVPIQCNDETVTDIKPWDLQNAIQDLSHTQTDLMAESEANEDVSLPLVMIVEDNPDIADYISLLLHSRYRVIKASDGYAALQLLSTQLPDIILTDLMMPGMDGYELCHAVRQSEILSDVPIVIISAKSEDKDRVRGYEDGADGYLLKPFNPSELQALITRLLAQRRQAHLHMQQLISDAKVSKRMTENDVEAKDKNVEERAFLEKLRTTVHKQMIAGDLQIDTIASLMCLSRSTFARRVKEITDSSPSAYILQLRLENACHLLRETQLSISEISLSCGFDELSYFSRVFRQNFDVTPSQYRNGQ